MKTHQSDIIDPLTVKAESLQEQQPAEGERDNQDAFNPKSNEHVLSCNGRYLMCTQNVLETSTEDPVLNWVGKNLDMALETSQTTKDAGYAAGIHTAIKSMGDKELFDLIEVASEELKSRGHDWNTLNTRKWDHAERLNILVTEMESIPPNANPFHHDDVLCGSMLPGGVTLMHTSSESFINKGFYLVFGKTGQRVKFTFVPKDLNKIQLL